jgi:hypothetical protein
MLFDRRRRRVVGVIVAAVLMATLGWGYLALAGSGEDRLVTKGIQQIVICRKGSSGSGDIWYKITQEIPAPRAGRGVSRRTETVESCATTPKPDRRTSATPTKPTVALIEARRRGHLYGERGS